MSADDRSHAGSPKPGPRLSARKLLRSTSVVSGMTLLSRILGLVRDIVFARMFGASIVMDAFIVANRIPNMLRRFFAEGAFSQGFVPVMARYRERHSETEARELIDAVAGTLGLVLFVVTLAGVIAAPLLVAVVAPGFIGDDGRFELSALMLRFTFPYLLFVSLTAFAGGVLNTYGRFAVPAFTPVILNVVLIGFAVWVSPLLAEPAMALAYAVFVAGLAQLLFQLPFLARIRALPRPRWRPGHEGVRRVGELMLPAIFGSSVAQINVLLGGVIASLLGVGKISLLYYSDRLMEFPLGLFGIALATVTLPYLSRQHAAASLDDFARTMDWSMKLVWLIAAPAAVGLIVLAEPLVATLFYGGEFSGSDVQLTALSLQAFSIGLLGFSFVKTLAPGYFAREDTRTPVKIGLIALLVNFLLSVALAWGLTRIGYEGTHAGLALATSVAALVNAWLLYRGLRRDGIIRHSAGWAGLLVKCMVANVAMVLCLVWLALPLDWWLDARGLDRALRLCVEIGAAVTVYFALLFALGIRTHTLRLHTD
ncbi:MAG: murein biosynthesis integral membrane protein MurJ [Gammaproteobacteria bacterium]|nr:murein biosynthesis integral membrane protein MurJ [Gammaproteobacteria bacterium]MDH4253370.1 murein biosynthesis integral membrane protein MurJ [Gammaproteobacteria bacterium]MDH5310144.1 murein biosynthesis integral membrane protein MurJ [Gammaproteobacteria bacterium]